MKIIQNIYNIPFNEHIAICTIVNSTWYSNKIKELLYKRLVEQLIIKESPLLDLEEFKKWLVGFTDAEGNFYIHARDYRCEFLYRIQLHNDDKLVLINILNQLNIKNNIFNDKRNNSKLFSISDKSIIIINKILPIFNENPLITKKSYDYNLFKEAIYLHNNNSFTNKNDLYLIFKKYNNMANKFETIDKYPSIEYTNKYINHLWAYGFIEGEGAFFINNTKFLIGFKLAQRKESINALTSLYYLIYNYPADINCNININLNKNNKIIYNNNKSGNVIQISFTHTDFNYWILIPFLLKYPLQTRKGIDIMLWIIVQIIKTQGLHKYNIATNIIENIKANHNSRRYFKENNYPTILKISKLFNKENIYNSNLTQDQNSRKHKLKMYD